MSNIFTCVLITSSLDGAMLHFSVNRLVGLLP